METENNTDVILCQNCENEHKIEFKFCPHCGQQTKEDLTVGVLFYNTISNYFSFDARFLRSFIPLMFKPGFIAKKEVEKFPGIGIVATALQSLYITRGGSS